MWSKIVASLKWFYTSVAKKAIQFFGGLIMEPKNGGAWVISLTRTLTLAIFCHCMWVWSVAVKAALPGAADLTQAVTKALLDVPQGELYTLWGLLGIAGVKVGGSQLSNVVTALKGSPDAE